MEREEGKIQHSGSKNLETQNNHNMPVNRNIWFEGHFKSSEADQQLASGRVHTGSGYV